MKKVFFVLFIALILSACHQDNQNITQRAIWKPTQKVLKQIFQCRDNPKTYLSCLVQVMKRNGASQAAIQFTQNLEGRGFMSEFQNLGNVDLVKTLELGADYSQGCYLVNGNPRIINVLLPNMLPANLWLKECKVGKIISESGIVSYVFHYEVKDCHACEVKGISQVSFRFDQQNNFLGFNIQK